MDMLLKRDLVFLSLLGGSIRPLCCDVPHPSLCALLPLLHSGVASLRMHPSGQLEEAGKENSREQGWEESGRAGGRWVRKQGGPSEQEVWKWWDWSIRVREHKGGDGGDSLGKEALGTTFPTLANLVSFFCLGNV